MQTLGYGILTWFARERRSNRYGSFYLSRSSYTGEGVATVSFDRALANSLDGKRVRVQAVVRTARKSGHIGDLFLGIQPTQPEVGEVVVLGIGTLELDDSGELSEDVPAIVLHPEDDRDDLWIDPRRLYRLHDQTIELQIEETQEEFSPAPNLNQEVEPDLVIAAEGGMMQIKGEPPVQPKVTNIGDGCLVVTGPDAAKKGDTFKRYS